MKTFCLFKSSAVEETSAKKAGFAPKIQPVLLAQDAAKRKPAARASSSTKRNLKRRNRRNVAKSKGFVENLPVEVAQLEQIYQKAVSAAKNILLTAYNRKSAIYPPPQRVGTQMRRTLRNRQRRCFTCHALAPYDQN